jgi:hypothetical protein
VTTVPTELRARIRHWTLLLGVLQLTVGCLVGFIPPTAVEWSRGIVMAHIELTANGVLMIAFALIVNDLHLGSPALWAWFGLLQIGTWTNGAAGLVAAFTGYSSRLMPGITKLFPPPRGPDHPAVTGLLMLCGVTIVLTLALTIVGLVRCKPAAVATPADS